MICKRRPCYRPPPLHLHACSDGRITPTPSTTKPVPGYRSCSSANSADDWPPCSCCLPLAILKVIYLSIGKPGLAGIHLALELTSPRSQPGILLLGASTLCKGVPSPTSDLESIVSGHWKILRSTMSALPTESGLNEVHCSTESGYLDPSA